MSLFSLIPQDAVTQLRPYWRRRWVVLVVAWVVSILGWLYIAVLPDRYEAMTRIYVETENLLTPLLRNIAVQTDVQKELEVLERTLLNRNNMAQVAHVTDMDLDVQTDFDKEQLYNSLSKRISIRAEGQNLFTVSFTDSNPQLAKKVVETLLNIFVETNMGQSRTSMESARNFIENQIAEYEQKLKQADQRLADYKAEHLDVLMATGANFAVKLDGMRQDENLARSKLSDATVARDQIRSSLASTPQFLEIEAQPQIIIGGGSGGSPRSVVQQRRQALADLQSRYTEHHPDVIAAKRALEEAEADLKNDQADRKAGGSGRGNLSNPVYEQLRLRLAQADSEVAQAQSHLNLVSQELQRLQGFAGTAPKVEVDLADLSREYGVIKSKFEELLARRESARISEAVEASGDKVQFRIVEAPQVPSRPTFPNRPLLAAAVLVAALGAGCVLVFLIHKFDDTVNTAALLTAEFNVPLLGTISRVESQSRAKERHRGARNFLIALGGLFVAFVLMQILIKLVYLPGILDHFHLAELVRRISGYAK